MLTIGFIGAGHMAQAMMAGWSGNQELQQLVYSPRSAAAVASQLKLETRASIMELWRDSDMVVIATPPTALSEIAEELRLANQLKPGVIVASVMGGVTLAELHAAIGEKAFIVRALPNVNVALKYGYTALAFDAYIDADTRGAIAMLFLDFGRTDEYPEAQFGAVSAVAGSGPAFVAAFAQALESAGLAAGLDNDKVAALVDQTVMGTAKNMHDNKIEPLAMMQSVATPGGSTEAGLSVLDGADQSLTHLIQATIEQTMAKNKTFEK